MDRYINYLMNETCMSKNCRRVVTGFDETGESIVVSDEFVRLFVFGQRQLVMPRNSVVLLWLFYRNERFLYTLPRKHVWSMDFTKYY